MKRWYPLDFYFRDGGLTWEFLANVRNTIAWIVANQSFFEGLLQ